MPAPLALQTWFLMIIMDVSSSPPTQTGSFPRGRYCVLFICVTYTDEPWLFRCYPRMKHQWLCNQKWRKTQSREEEAVWGTSLLQTHISDGSLSRVINSTAPGEKEATEGGEQEAEGWTLSKYVLDELVPPICHSKVPSRLSKLKLPLKLTARKTCASSKEPWFLLLNMESPPPGCSEWKAYPVQLPLSPWAVREVHLSLFEHDPE